MTVDALFREFGLTKFCAEYLHRLPFAMPGAVREVQSLGSWDTLGRVLECDDATVLVVRGGERLEMRPSSEADARRLNDEGYTIVVRRAQRHDAPLGALAESFERTFCGEVDVQMFVTPPGQAGFSWHYDAEDVFILQTAGAKEYGLRKNTVNPWPLEETLPADMKYEREIMPLMSVALAAGDMLYIPCGYWHKADASRSAEAAISLAVGVMSRTGMDVFDSLRPRLLESLLWRQRLPIVGDGSPVGHEEVEAAYRGVFAELGKDLARVLADPRVVRDFLARSVGGDECDDRR